ncbi:MAG: phosphoribosyltransferase family protein [Patescibacteria group bacterium]|nr:phosphoribosyltransferase family protein [Patescibacteria group bacterium]
MLSSGQVCDSVAQIMATQFLDADVEVVVGPTYGAVGLAAEVAGWLICLGDRDVQWAFAQEKTVTELFAPIVDGAYGEPVTLSRPIGRERIIGRYFPEIVKDAKVLVVEDVLASGGSVMETNAAVRAVGGIVVGTAVICNRGGVTADQLGVPILYSMFDIPMEMSPEEECPMCRAGKPINMQVGHGKLFYERHPGSVVPRQL